MTRYSLHVNRVLPSLCERFPILDVFWMQIPPRHFCVFGCRNAIVACYCVLWYHIPLSYFRCRFLPEQMLSGEIDEKKRCWIILWPVLRSRDILNCYEITTINMYFCTSDGELKFCNNRLTVKLIYMYTYYCSWVNLFQKSSRNVKQSVNFIINKNWHTLTKVHKHHITNIIKQILSFI